MMQLPSTLRRLNVALVIVGVFSLGINLLMLTVPIYTLQVYDRVLSSGSMMTLAMLTLVAVGLIAACSLLDMIRARLLARVAGFFEDEFGGRAFRADAVARSGGLLDDVAVVRNFLAGPAIRCLFDLPWVPLWLALLFLMHPLIGGVALAGAVVLMIAGYLADVLARGPHARTHAHGNDARVIAGSLRRSREAVVALGLAANLEREWKRPQMASLVERMSSNAIGGMMSALSRGFRQMLQVAVLGVGAYLAVGGVITPGVVVAASLIMARALAPIEGLGGQWRGVAAARAAFLRVRDIADVSSPAARMTPAASIGHLRADNLIIGFPERQGVVLTGVSFALEPGTVLGVMGRIGSGKSALLQTLVGLVRPRWGMVSLDGSDIAHWDDQERGQHVGYLPGTAELIGGTVAKNIARHGDVDTESVIAAARRAGVHELIAALPDGYNTLLADGGSNISAGQRQAVALARAIYGEPALVVLDEPTSNSDFAGDRQLARLLQELKKAGVTTVVATRQASLLACADKLLLLDGGRMQMFGDRDEVGSRFLMPPFEQQGRVPSTSQDAA